MPNQVMPMQTPPIPAQEIEFSQKMTDRESKRKIWPVWKLQKIVNEIRIPNVFSLRSRNRHRKRFRPRPVESLHVFPAQFMIGGTIRYGKLCYSGCVGFVIPVETDDEYWQYYYKLVNNPYAMMFYRDVEAKCIRLLARVDSDMQQYAAAGEIVREYFMANCQVPIPEPVEYLLGGWPFSHDSNCHFKPGAKVFDVADD